MGDVLVCVAVMYVTQQTIIFVHIIICLGSRAQITLVKIETSERLASKDLFAFNEYLVKNEHHSQMCKENGDLDVLQVFGAKVRNLGRKKGNGFHIQGSTCAQKKTEAWLSAYHCHSLIQCG